MANEKFVNRPRVFVLGGYRISEAADEVNSSVKRASVDGPSYEDPGAVTFKGPYQTEGTLAGAGSAAESDLLTRLAADASTLFCDLLESNAASSPFSAVGDHCLFYKVHVADLDLPRQKGALNRFSVNLKSAGDYPFFGRVMYCNLGGTPLGSGTTTSTAIQLGTVPAGVVMAFGVFVVDPPGLTGTTPTVDLDIESDNASGFSSPTTRASIVQVVPAGVPNAQFLLLDGDVAAITDDYWRASIDVGGTSPGATILVVGARRAKT